MRVSVRRALTVTIIEIKTLHFHFVKISEEKMDNFMQIRVCTILYHHQVASHHT